MKKKILIVDDEPHMRKLAAFSLRKGGYDFVFAEDGSEVEQMMTTERPDLVVMDVGMSLMDGLSALRMMRAQEDGTHIPVIVLTGIGTMSPESASATGADVLMMKPYSPTQLLHTAKELLVA